MEPLSQPRTPISSETSPAFLSALLRAFGDLPEKGRVPETWWSDRGKVFGLPLALRSLWEACGLGPAMRSVSGDPLLAEHALRVVCCAVCEPTQLLRAERWISGLAWINTAKTTADDVKHVFEFLGREKIALEHAQYLEGRTLFDLSIDQGLLLHTDAVVVLFRERALPVAFEWIEEGRVADAAERLLRRFTPRSSRLLEGHVFSAGIAEVFRSAVEEGSAPSAGQSVAAFLALGVLAELRRRLPDDVSTLQALRGLGEVRALEVAMGARSYLVRQPVAAGVRSIFKALDVKLPRRILPLAVQRQPR